MLIFFGWIVSAAAFRWIAFDILFNIIQGWEWTHYGKSAWLDKQLTKLGRWHLVPKIILLLTGISMIRWG